MDGGEYGIYVGSEDGRIFAINLFELGDSSAEILAGFDDPWSYSTDNKLSI